ncbi:MAG: xylose isomerase [Acidobacteria bacterium]|nr:xylose isomerase [Acidobacteriota bacterium]
MTRRHFLGITAAAAGLAPSATDALAQQPNDSLFRISLAQWSLNRTIFGPRDNFNSLLRTDPDAVLRGSLHPLDFARTARRDFGIEGIEYVNTFFFGHARDEPYLRDLRQRADDEGVTSLLIMCDAEGDLGDPDAAGRALAIENHHKWVDAAAFLGCHSIRVNARSRGPWGEQARNAADGLSRLADYADGHDINVIVENHGGLSSNGQWLSSVMAMVGHPRVGTLPDFGNFNLGDGETYDSYQGVSEMMPYAKAVSAKSHDFDADGNNTTVDFERMMRIVLDAGYRGWVGIEYEGRQLAEADGIRRTKALLERVRTDLDGQY